MSDKEIQKLNPPQSPLVRGDDVSNGVARRSRGASATPPLTRGGREGLGFLPYNPKLTTLARENRKNPTPAEQKIWHEVLHNRQFAAYKFLRQKPIDRFIVDFYCAKLSLVIEIDGDSHAEEPAYDIERTQVLRNYGLNIVRYNNRDVLHNISGVYDDLIEQIS